MNGYMTGFYGKNILYRMFAVISKIDEHIFVMSLLFNEIYMHDDYFVFLYLYSGYLLTVLKRLHYQKHPSVTYFVRHYVAKVVPTANNIK